MMRATMRLLSTVAVVGVMVVAACTGGGPQSTAQPGGAGTGHPPVSSQPPVAVGTPVPAGGQPGGQTSQLDRCHTSGLAVVAIGVTNGAAGSAYQELGLRNNSLNACWVYGF